MAESAALRGHPLSVSALVSAAPVSFLRCCCPRHHATPHGSTCTVNECSDTVLYTNLAVWGSPNTELFTFLVYVMTSCWFRCLANPADADVPSASYTTVTSALSCEYDSACMICFSPATLTNQGGVQHAL